MSRLHYARKQLQKLLVEAGVAEAASEIPSGRTARRTSHERSADARASRSSTPTTTASCRSGGAGASSAGSRATPRARRELASIAELGALLREQAADAPDARPLAGRARAARRPRARPAPLDADDSLPAPTPWLPAWLGAGARGGFGRRRDGERCALGRCCARGIRPLARREGQARDGPPGRSRRDHHLGAREAEAEHREERTRCSGLDAPRAAPALALALRSPRRVGAAADPARARRQLGEAQRSRASTSR